MVAKNGNGEATIKNNTARAGVNDKGQEWFELAPLLFPTEIRPANDPVDWRRGGASAQHQKGVISNGDETPCRWKTMLTLLVWQGAFTGWSTTEQNQHAKQSPSGKQ